MNSQQVKLQSLMQIIASRPTYICPHCYQHQANIIYLSIYYIFYLQMELPKLFKRINSLGSINRSEDSISTLSHTHKPEPIHEDFFKYNNFAKEICCEQSSDIRKQMVWLGEQIQQKYEAEQIDESSIQKKENTSVIQQEQFCNIKQKIESIDTFKISIKKEESIASQQTAKMESKNQIKIVNNNLEIIKTIKKDNKKEQSLTIKKQETKNQVEKIGNIIHENKVIYPQNMFKKKRRNKIFSQYIIKVKKDNQIQNQVLTSIRKQINMLKQETQLNKHQILNIASQKQLENKSSKLTNNQGHKFLIYRKLIKLDENIISWFNYLSKLSAFHLCKQQEVIKKILKNSISFSKNLEEFKHTGEKGDIFLFEKKSKLIENSISITTFIKSNYQTYKSKSKIFSQFLKNFLKINPLQKLVKYANISLVLSEFKLIRTKHQKKLQKQNIVEFSQYNQDFKKFIDEQISEMLELDKIFEKTKLQKQFEEKKEQYLKQTKQKLIKGDQLSDLQRFKIIEHLNNYKIEI